MDEHPHHHQNGNHDIHDDGNGVSPNGLPGGQSGVCTIEFNKSELYSGGSAAESGTADTHSDTRPLDMAVNGDDGDPFEDAVPVDMGDMGRLSRMTSEENITIAKPLVQRMPAPSRLLDRIAEDDGNDPTHGRRSVSTVFRSPQSTNVPIDQLRKRRTSMDVAVETHRRLSLSAPGLDATGIAARKASGLLARGRVPTMITGAAASAAASALNMSDSFTPRAVASALSPRSPLPAVSTHVEGPPRGSSSSDASSDGSAGRVMRSPEQRAVSKEGWVDRSASAVNARVDRRASVDIASLRAIHTRRRASVAMGALDADDRSRSLTPLARLNEKASTQGRVNSKGMSRDSSVNTRISSHSREISISHEIAISNVRHSIGSGRDSPLLHTPSPPPPPLPQPSDTVVHLPRGGFIVKTRLAGNIQFVMPPETVKDAMILKLQTPEHYVFTDRRFDKNHGVNLGEFEFPTYFNFFVKRRQVNLICTKTGEAAIRRIFQETLFGPEEIDEDMDYVEDFPPERRADLRKELNHFRKNPFNPQEIMQIETLIRFTLFDDRGVATVAPGCEIVHLPDTDEFQIREEGVELCKVPAWFELDIERAAAASRHAEAPADEDVVFDPPTLGVTFLGTSHGFDPAGSTTGMVVWINGRGVVVDPPPHCSHYLRSNHTPASLIDAIILSHCHADHDSGTFQRIIEESKVVVMSTPTIMNSFVRKYSAITNLPEEFLWSLFEFRPVRIGEPLRFRGGEFSFFYSLHSIPCIGFSLAYGGKSLVFSGDTYNDPAGLEKMRQAGTLSQGRFNDLLNFQWHHDAILHEAGVPPIHTPLSTFHPLSDDVKKRLFLVHTAEKDVPKDCGLKIAKSGVQHSLRLDVREPLYKPAIALMDLLCSIDLFAELDMTYASSLLHLAAKQEFPKGSAIVRQGDPGNTFFVIASGEVSVVVNGQTLNKTFTTGDFFGEVAVLSRDKRTASIVALTTVQIYEFDGDMLFYLLNETGAVTRLKNIASMRQEHSWAVITRNTVLCNLTSAQKTSLQGILHKRRVSAGDLLWKEGGEVCIAVLIDEGDFELRYPKNGRRAARKFRSGAFIGEMSKMDQPVREPHSTRLKALTDGKMFLVERRPFVDFVRRNPGLQVSLWQENWLE